MAWMGSSSLWTHHPTMLAKATAASDAQPWMGGGQTLPKLCFAQAAWTKPTSLTLLSNPSPAFRSFQQLMRQLEPIRWDNASLKELALQIPSKAPPQTGIFGSYWPATSLLSEA